MELFKRIKTVIILIGVIIVGYVVFNQLFYEPPIGPVINEPEDPNESPEKPDEEDPFEGMYVERIPYVDISNEVQLIHQVDQAFISPLPIYQWEQLNMPVYEKEIYDFDQLNEIALNIYDTIDVEKDELYCSKLDQDDWKIVVCEFQQGYIEVIQDGSYYVILHDYEEVEIDSYEISHIEDVIIDSWLKDMIPWKEYEVVLEMIHYDSFDQMKADISIVEKTSEEYREKLTLNISYQHSSIIGLSKSANRKEAIMNVDIISMDDIEGLLRDNKFNSTMLEVYNFDEIQILGYELLYDSTTYKDAIIPSIHVITTSMIDSYVNCFEAEGIVIHPLKIMGTSDVNIRVR